jgi:transposase-like protein
MVEMHELPERWSAKKKSEIVLRLLRGEDLGELSREIQVPPPEIEQWREAFLSGAESGLKKRSGDPLERELVRTRAKLGETMMRLELAEELLEKRGFADDLKKLRRPGLG